MRWDTFYCVFLATIAMTYADRPKRDLNFFKSLLFPNLYRSSTVVVAQPIFQNDTVQLFAIPGNNNVLIKLTNNKADGQRFNPLMVPPGMDFLSTYYGSSSQSETLHAVQVAEDLVKTGILNGQHDNTIKEVIVPTVPQSPNFDLNQRPIGTYYNGHGSYYVTPGIPEPVFPPLAVASGVQLSPANPAYSYKQTGYNADTTYESFDGKNVIVTRTDKEPPLPKYLKIRIQDVAMIGANPYLIPPPVPVAVAPIPMNIAPVPVMYERPGVWIPEPVIRVPTPSYHPHVFSTMNSNTKGTGNTGFSKPPIVSGVNGANPLHINLFNTQNQQSNNNNKQDVIKTPTTNVNTSENSNKAEEHKRKIEQLIQNQTVNGNLVSQYVYKQMNLHSDDKYTEVNVGNVINAPTTTQTVTDEELKKGSKDFVFVPPKGVSFDPTNWAKTKNTASTQTDNKNLYTSKPYVPLVSSAKPCCVNLIDSSSFTLNPIIVTEESAMKRNLEESGNRGDIPTSM